MFELLPLSMNDCAGEFGLTAGFADACPAPVSIPVESQNSLTEWSRKAADYAIWDTHTFDPWVEQALGSVDWSMRPASEDMNTLTTSDRNEDLDSAPNHCGTDGDAGENKDNSPAQLHSIQTNRKRNRPGPTSHAGSKKHKKKVGSIVATGNFRFSPIRSMNLWDQFMDSSPLFNPLERRVLRYLALRVLNEEAYNCDHEKIPTIQQVNIGAVHWPLLDRAWAVFIASIRLSQFEFKHWLRPKAPSVLKQQLSEMVDMSRFQEHFNKRTPVRSMITSLGSARNILNNLTHIRTTRSVVTTTTVEVRDTVDIQIQSTHPAANQLITQDSIDRPEEVDLDRMSELNSQDAQDDFLNHLVASQKATGKRLRWKRTIAPEFNARFPNNQKTHKQLKNRLDYLRSLSNESLSGDNGALPDCSTTPNSADNNAEIDVTTDVVCSDPGIRASNVSDDPLAYTEPDCDLHLDHNTDTNDNSSGVSWYRTCSSSLASIRNTVIAAPPPRLPFTDSENELFQYLLRADRNSENI